MTVLFNQPSKIRPFVELCQLQLIAAYYIHNERQLWWHILCVIENLVNWSKITPFRRNISTLLPVRRKENVVDAAPADGPLSC